MSSDGPSSQCPVITLDGLAGSGKSTLARRLAMRLGWAYLDSGAWYRALTWAVLQQPSPPPQASASDPDEEAPKSGRWSPQAILDTLFRIDIHCHPDGSVVVDGQPLRQQIRTPEIDRAVADVADPPEVRSALVDRMRRLRSRAGLAGIVADGRDAGTVIFPDAGLKVFVHADLETRAGRRFQQGRSAGLQLSLDDVLERLRERDRRDGARGDSAPRPLPGGRILDNNHLTVEEAIGRLLAWVENPSESPPAEAGRDFPEPGFRQT
ncbi:MAG: (d)CMP kinase [Planctomycetota bacterium]|nr:MAG: (d)CMP kinase [Planctomycetota bacterium]